MKRTATLYPLSTLKNQPSFVQLGPYNPLDPTAIKRPSVVGPFQGIFTIVNTCALAALAVVSAASAQSTLTIDGYIDRGYVSTNNTNNTKDAKSVSSNAGTTTVGIKGSEDLGGGLKAGFSVNTDWSEASGQSQDGTPPTSAQSGFANGQSYLELISAQVGTLRLGNPNSEVLTITTGVASPAFSTGVGSAYSSTFSIHNGYGTGKTGDNNIISNSTIGAGTSAGTNAGQRQIRQANTIKYISPTFSGFNVILATVRKNDTGGTTDVVGVTEFAANYTNGPLVVGFASTKISTGASVYANNSTSNGTGMTANSSSTMSILGASYQVLPVLKLHAGLGRSSSSGVVGVPGTANGTTAPDTSSYQVGATYNVTPVITLMAQYVKVNDKSFTDLDRTLTGLGADYSFSKTTRAYVRYDNVNYASNFTAFNGTKQTRTAIGVSKSF